MSSVADEIQKLFKLHEQGILTAEEFKEAKIAAIQKGGRGSIEETSNTNPTAVASHPTLTGQYLVNIETFFEESLSNAHERCYQHLTTILTNILYYPKEIKYRKLRLENPVLNSELFSDPGAVPFLENVLKFERIDTSSAPVIAQIASSCEANLKMGEGDVLLLKSPPKDLALLEACLAALEHLRMRDQKAQDAQRDYLTQLHSISLSIRQERWSKAREGGELPSYILSELGKNHELEVKEGFTILETALSNIIQHPAEAKYHLLKMTNPIVRERIFALHGGLEILIALAGFEFKDQGLIYDPQHTKLDQLQHALEYVQSAKKKMQAKWDEEKAQARKEAIALALKEREVEKREQFKQQRKKEGGSQVQDMKSTEEAGERVPIAEAISRLLGRKLSDSSEESDED